MSVAIIDYGSGNLRSVAKAFEYMSDGEEIIVTSDANIVKTANRIVLPGVGAFADCMAGLNAVPGMSDALYQTVIEDQRPFLGICVGMQLLASIGEEFGETAGLGWINGRIKAIKPHNKDLKIPHMGWNILQEIGNHHPVLDGLENGAYVYFVHSFHFIPDDKNKILATVDYGQNLTAVIGRDNIIATQFHPEKSQQTGLRLISNFLKWRP